MRSPTERVGTPSHASGDRFSLVISHWGIGNGEWRMAIAKQIRNS
ncbi:hypothetical protein [Nostoc sp.]